METKKSKHELEEELTPLAQLAASEHPLGKATTIAVIIDCTQPYRNVQELYTVKLQLIDPTCNPSQLKTEVNNPYLTTYIKSEVLSNLPRPKRLGDIIYLKRFKFTKYKDQFQAFNYPNARYCSWTLFEGTIERPNLEPYQTSKEIISFKEEEERNLTIAVKQLREFASQFLNNYSLVNIQPYNAEGRDKNILVKILKKEEKGPNKEYVVTDGRRELLVTDVQSEGEEGAVAKLRSVVRIDKGEGIDVVQTNIYTSLIAMP